MASISKGAKFDNRTGGSFAQLLDWHLTRGTRPERSPDVAGPQWSNVKFAVVVNSDERTIRNWRYGRNVPVDVCSIERALFGENPSYTDWRGELREAHQASRTSQKDGKPKGLTALAGKLLPSSNGPSSDEEHIRRLFREELARIAEEKGVPVAPLLAVLEKLGAAAIVTEEIPKRLAAAADELLVLRQDLKRLRNDRPEFTAIRDHALALIDAGDLDDARTVLNRGREAARALREETSLSEAEFLANEAHIDHLQLAYGSAAQRYADAARLIEVIDQQKQWVFLLAQGHELFSLGDEFGESQALAEAIGVYRQAAAIVIRELAPLDWAMTQNELGNALLRLGERESGTTRLEEAVTTYLEALKERTRERVPLQWAATQSNLGNALQTLGCRERGTARLENAIAAYLEALSVRTREKVPLDWAITQNNLGNALQTLGWRERGITRLEEGVAAYRNALQERTRERVPLQWARTQNNLGNALWKLGERESGTTRLEESVAAYRDALQERTRERVPLQWAMTQHGLGNALRRLGERESGTASLEEAVAAYRNALQEFTRERVPLDWALSTGNQGIALRILADRRGDLTIAEQALVQTTEAFETCRNAKDSFEAAYFEGQLPAHRATVDLLRKG